MPKIINEIGNIYGNLQVIEQMPSVNGRRYWKCQCKICKRIEILSGTVLRNGSKKCCDGVKLTYGELTIQEYAYTAKDRHIYYKCKCSCGNTENIKGTLLFTGKQTKCSICSKTPAYNFIDETGKTYGNLTVIERDFNIDRKEVFWKCQCKCGNITTVKGSKLRNGSTTSCGCIKSKGEETIIRILLDNNIEFQTQVKFSQCKNIDLLRFDFAIYKNDSLSHLIEYDGIQHFQAGSGWNTQEQLESTQYRDNIKNNFCIENNIPLIRIPYTVLNKITINDLMLETTKYLI